MLFNGQCLLHLLHLNTQFFFDALPQSLLVKIKGECAEITAQYPKTSPIMILATSLCRGWVLGPWSTTQVVSHQSQPGILSTLQLPSKTPVTSPAGQAKWSTDTLSSRTFALAQFSNEPFPGMWLI